MRTPRARRAGCGCASPTASWTPRCANRDRPGRQPPAVAREGPQAPPHGGPQPQDGKPSYEAASARVEEIIRRLDSGEASLDETLALLSEGKTLIELCAGELAAVGDALQELRLDELVTRLEGSGES